MSDSPNITATSWLSILLLGFVWGGTFLVIELALQTMTPFWIAAARIGVRDALDACHLEHFGAEALAELTSSMGLPHNCRDSLLCTSLHATKLGVTICNLGLRRCFHGGCRTPGSSIVPFFGCWRANDTKKNSWVDSRFLRSGYLNRWKRVYIYWLGTGNTWASCLLRGCRVLCSKLNCNAPSASSGSDRSCRSPSCLWFIDCHTCRICERRSA